MKLRNVPGESNKFLFTLQTYTNNQQMKLHYKFLGRKL